MSCCGVPDSVGQIKNSQRRQLLEDAYSQVCNAKISVALATIIALAGILVAVLALTRVIPMPSINAYICLGVGILALLLDLFSAKRLYDGSKALDNAVDWIKAEEAKAVPGAPEAKTTSS